jgi:hypothetical protein
LWTACAVHAQTEEAIFAPVRRPRVANHPVLTTLPVQALLRGVYLPKADEHDAVVDFIVGVRTAEVAFC